MEVKEIMNLAAFVPEYQAGVGQGVKVYLRNGEEYFVRVSMRTFINRISSALFVNLHEVKAQSRILLGQKNLLPLAFSPFIIFVPAKTRVPLVTGDPAYGYFRLRSIMEFCIFTAGIKLHLEGNHFIEILHSKRTFLRRLRSARILETEMLSHYQQIMSPQVALNMTIPGGWIREAVDKF